MEADSEVAMTNTLFARFYIQESLAESASLARLHRIISEVLPEWSKRLSVAKNEDAEYIVLERYGSSLYETVMAAAPLKWGFNGFLVRGDHDKIRMSIQSSKSTVPPESNGLFVEVDAEDPVDGRGSSDRVRDLIDRVAAELAVRYAYGCEEREFDAKNMVREKGSVRAIGVNLSVALPGVYWINYFGPMYTDLIGVDRLKSAPARELHAIDGGFMMMLDELPNSWWSEDYRRRESALVEHLGPKFFFSKEEPERQTIAPAFERSRGKR